MTPLMELRSQKCVIDHGAVTPLMVLRSRNCVIDHIALTGQRRVHLRHCAPWTKKAPERVEFLSLVRQLEEGRCAAASWEGEEGWQGAKNCTACGTLL